MTYGNNQPYFNQNMGSSYIEYEQQGQSQIIQNQPSQQGPISLPSLAGSLKNYTNSQSTVANNHPKEAESPNNNVAKIEPVRPDISMRDKDKEADKAKKKGTLEYRGGRI